jgi:protein TonB
MNFAEQHRDPRQHIIGITAVVVFHIALIYALANGLAHKVVDVLKKPLEVSLIDEVKKVAPPPPKEAPPPPKVIEPPPAFVPPPEVQLAPPPVEAPVIAVVTPVPPPPAPARVVAAPKTANVGVVCPNHLSVRSKVQYPAQAQRMGITGQVLVEFLVGPDGSIGGVKIVKSTNPIFNASAAAAVAQLHCVGQEQSVRIQVPFVFELEH